MMTDRQTSLLERYQRLSEISRDIVSTLDINTLLDRIVQAAADLSQAEAASILLYDESKGQLFFESATNLDEPLMRGLIVPVDGSIAGWIVTHRQPIIIANAQRDTRHYSHVQKITRFRTKSLLGVPMIAKGQIIGVLEALNKRSGLFTQEDQDVLLALSAQAAVAIENTRLFQQSDIIAEMVHELRTPLASLNTAAHLLLKSDLPEEKRRTIVQLINKETTRLSDLASAFLDFARLESGRMQFNPENFDLGILLQECAEFIREKAVESGLEVLYQPPENLPPIKGDRDKIKQVVLNLMTNAIKYNRPGGSITIAAESHPDHVRFSVADTGIGIPREDLPRLGERFYRSFTSEKAAPGTGLGLAICRRIVEAHAGSIEVHSEVNQGATFAVILPLKTGGEKKKKR